MKQSNNALALAAALAGLAHGTAVRSTALPLASVSIASTGVGTQADIAGTSAKKEKHSCKGQNSCKGKGGCASGDNGCKGKNTCKGKGGCATNGKM